MKAAPPETLTQAQGWEKTKTRYVQAGLCHRCAAQAAWAHQEHGDTWDTIHPPCPSCAPIVATFSLPSTSLAWRKCPRGVSGGQTRGGKGIAPGGVPGTIPALLQGADDAL